MRLTIIPLVNPTEHQYQDLYKIWIDQTQPQLIQALKSDQQFFAARFNDRLLAAAKVSINRSQGTISDFCVREVTRRRGVGLYLLQEICRQQPEVKHWYFNFNRLEVQQKIIIEKFLSACGFSATVKDGEWDMKIGE